MSATNQVTIDPSSSLYNMSHKGVYILSPNPYTFYDHFKSTMVYIVPYGALFLIFDPFV